MGTLAIEALDRFPKHERNITSSTVFLSESAYSTVCKRVDEFRDELLTMLIHPAQANEFTSLIFKFSRYREHSRKRRSNHV